MLLNSILGDAVLRIKMEKVSLKSSQLYKSPMCSKNRLIDSRELDDSCTEERLRCKSKQNCTSKS